jgi:hypothetical protein
MTMNYFPQAIALKAQVLIFESLNREIAASAYAYVTR